MEPVDSSIRVHSRQWVTLWRDMTGVMLHAHCQITVHHKLNTLQLLPCRLMMNGAREKAHQVDPEAPLARERESVCVCY